MKKICFDARMALRSGIGTYIRNLLPYIQRQFPALQVVVTPALLEQYPRLGKFDLILIKAPIYSIQEQWEIPFRIPCCDLFWSPHYNIPCLPLRAKKRLVTIHDIYHLAYGKSLGWAKRVYANLMLRAASTYSDHIVTVSHFSKSEISRLLKVSPHKISVIHNGVDQQLFSLPRLKVESLSHLPKKYMVFVSQLAPHKNLGRLVEAWNLVIQRHAGFHLVIVGKAKKGQELPKLSPYVHLLGDVPDDHLAALYAGASALVYPSLYEGFGLPPLEAMAMGCPVITSNVASLPEICQEAALYIDPWNVQDIAEKICTLIENRSLRQTLIDKGKERMDAFNWETAAHAHIEVIQRLLQHT